MRLLPNRLKVVVKERMPVAFVEINSHIQLIDANGVIMELPANSQASYSFPVIVGIDGSGAALDPGGAHEDLHATHAKNWMPAARTIPRDLSDVDLSDPDDVKATVTDPHGAVLVHLGSSNFLERFKIYVAHVQEWRTQFQKLQSVDLRYEHQVIVNPDAVPSRRQRKQYCRAGSRCCGRAPKKTASPQKRKEAQVTTMGSQTENLLTVIDVGSAKTCVIVAEVNDYALRYRGHGISDSRGMRKGVIADLDKAVDSIKKAVEEAENVAQAPVEHAVVGVAGSHIRGVNSHGGISLGSRSREISREDVRQAVEKARSIAMPEDREPLHLLPQEFIVDGQGGVHDPAGLMGRKLEVRVHVVTAGTTATQNVVTAVNRAGIHVDDTVFEALACADSVLQTDERELGVCLVDIGAGSTDLIVYFEGVVIHTGVIPIGGDHFTNDVRWASARRCPMPRTSRRCSAARS